ncbi:hypothetical protein ACVU7I_00015 [Patulibacter sp. S7RM1-6]
MSTPPARSEAAAAVHPDPMAEAMRAAHHAGGAGNTSRRGYAAWRQGLDDPASAPSVRAILERFGSWTAARDALVTVLEPTEADALALIRRCAAATGSVPTMWSFDSWATKERPAPGLRAREIVTRFGRWRDLLKRAELPIGELRARSPAAPRPVPAERAERARRALRQFAAHLGLQDADAATSYDVAYRLRRAEYAAWRQEHCPAAPAESSVHGWYGRWAGALHDAGLASAPKAPPQPRRFDDADLVRALKAAAATTNAGRALTGDDYEEWQRTEAGAGAPTRRYIADRHGSWTTALIAAGLVDAEPATESLPALRAFLSDAELGAVPTPEHFLQWTARRRRKAPTVREIMREYGTWRAAISAAGGEPPDRNPTGRVWENAKILDALARWAATEQDDLTHARYRGWARDEGAPAPADGVASARFGSWTGALAAAGLEPAASPASDRQPHDPGSVDRALRAFAAAVPEPRERSSYRYDAWRGLEARWAPSSTTLGVRFGSWPAVREHVRALEDRAALRGSAAT